MVKAIPTHLTQSPPRHTQHNVIIKMLPWAVVSDKAMTSFSILH